MSKSIVPLRLLDSITTLKLFDSVDQLFFDLFFCQLEAFNCFGFQLLPRLFVPLYDLDSGQTQSRRTTEVIKR